MSVASEIVAIVTEEVKEEVTASKVRKGQPLVLDQSSFCTECSLTRGCCADFVVFGFAR